jgi:hypothetical protein
MLFDLSEGKKNVALSGEVGYVVVRITTGTALLHSGAVRGPSNCVRALLVKESYDAR